MPLTLRDVVARGTPLEWFESVAIAQELAAAVLKDAGEGTPRVPDLPGAELTDEGGVRVLEPGDADQAPVFRLAHVLNTLLSNASPPMQLRLLVLTALSPEPTYKTVFEFSRALEYFERPDRRNVNRAIYERAQALAPVDDDLAPLPARPEPAPESKEKKEKAAVRLGRSERVFLAVAIPLVVVFLLGGWWATRPSGAKVLSDTKALVSKAVSATVDTIRSATGRPATAATVEGPAPAPAPAPAPSMRHLAPTPIKPTRSFARNGVAPIVRDAPTARPPARSAAPMRVDEVVWLEPPSDSDAAASPTYSAADADVRPPVAVRPKLPTEPPPGVPLESLTRLEVLLSTSGEVESVKIVAGPRSSLDGMMLSAVKAWKFQPATRDGRPVPYRHLVWLTNTEPR